MTDKITVELSAEYAGHLALLKQIIPSATGEKIKEDSKMVEALIDSFMSFIQEQAWAHEHGEGCCWEWEHKHHWEEECCGWKNHSKEDKGPGGCGCK
jgi:hypothetical protein